MTLTIKDDILWIGKLDIKIPNPLKIKKYYE